MIELKELSKTFGSFTAVDKISFEIPQGEIFGFLGPNGAGKTTAIKMLMGILVPTGGSARVAGLDCQKDRVELKRRVGYLPDTPIFYDYLRGYEVVSFVAEMHGQPAKLARENSMRLLTELGLAGDVDEFAVNYSLGMKKKLGLACALVHNPKVLILDEPTNALDPRASRDVQVRLKKFTSEGGTVLLSTHLMDMAQRICQRVAVINQGRIVALGTVESIRQSFATGGDLEELFMKLTEDGPTAT